MTKKPIVFPEVDASGEQEFALDDSWPTRYADCQKSREEGWVKLAEQYEADPKNLHVVWHWLNNHPVFYYYTDKNRHHEATLSDGRGVDEGLELRPGLVDKVTRTTGGPEENTELEIWVEAFPCSLTHGTGGFRMHDVELDTGAPTYEEALIKVAALIYERHGHDRTHLEEAWDRA